MMGYFMLFVGGAFVVAGALIVIDAMKPAPVIIDNSEIHDRGETARMWKAKIVRSDRHAR
jgi:hypothetical protein